MQIETVFLNEIKDRFEARHYLISKRIEHIFKKYPFYRIGKFSMLNGGSTPPLKNFVSDFLQGKSFPFIKSADVKKFQINTTDISYIDIDAHIKLLKSSVVKPNDILIAMTGKYLGSVGMTWDDIQEGNINQNVVRIRINTEQKIEPEYLLLILNSSFGQNQIQSLLTLTGQKYLNQIKIAEIKIPIIEKSIRERLVRLIRMARRNHISALYKLNQAKQILEKEINVKHQNIKEEKVYSVNSQDLTDILTPKFYYPKYLNTLKQLKKKFKIVKLGKIADIKRGNEVGSKNYKKYIDKKNSDVPFIRTSDLVNYEIDNYPDFYIDEEIYEELNQDLKEGDLLVSNDGKIGLLAILTKEDKCIIQSHIRRIRFLNKIDPYYTLVFLSTAFGQFQFKQFTFTQATIPTISFRLTEIEIPLISSQKQKKISQLVTEAFKLKGEKKRLTRTALMKVEELLK